MPIRALEAVVLRDNVAAARSGLAAGHGLAMFVRADGDAVLFDTGDSAQTWVNAAGLGLDVSEALCVALSHGHYDHTGGLPALVRRLGRVVVLAHPAIFERRWAEREGGGREWIGPPASREQMEAEGAIFELSAEPAEPTPGLLTTGEVPRVSELAPRSPHLLVEREGELRVDDFRDDLSLVARMEEGDVLLTGCAHAGLVNIVARAEQITGRCPVAIAGGTHLAAESEERIARVAEELYARGVRQVAPMHCSGERGADLLETHFAGETLRAGVGSRIVADATGRIVVQ
ncbi:MAG: MBL fold metallo-hydrolase [Armatimonadota bacterium]|jgi:7,8-dihydropterin-6-yl-methyl-4-(beta-D-ribofuranosyl)aminobenzene 5'-phosphate synthase